MIRVWLLENEQARWFEFEEPHDMPDDVTVTMLTETEQPAQQEPAAYDKTELNCFAQDLYDQKMREGKRGHYESMFHVIHQCVKKVAPAQRPWVGLSEEEILECRSANHLYFYKAIEAKLKEKNT